MNYPKRWIDIMTCTPCPNRCSYCPQDVLIKAYKGEKFLSLSNFKKILNNIPKDVNINFSGFAETFVNQETPDMMIYAYEQGYQVSTWTTLVGLTEENAKRLESIKFNFFHVHDIGQERKTYPYTDAWEEAIPNSRAGNLYDEPRQEKINSCSMGSGFNQNVMLPNGDVVICCQDWALKNVIGNLYKDNYNDLNRNWDKELCHYCFYNRCN